MKSIDNNNCPQLGTCEGCSNKECLDKVLVSGVCLVHGVKGCYCEFIRDENNNMTCIIRKKKPKGLS